MSFDKNLLRERCAALPQALPAIEWIPSTFRSATLGRLCGRGFGGVGSINRGPLASTGHVLACRLRAGG